MSDIPEITLRSLKDRVNDGYNLAVVVPLDQDIRDLEPLQNSIPVLAEAEGPLGVLRAMEIRQRGIQAYMADTGKAFQLWHLVFTSDDPVAAVLNYYRFTLTREA
jgi:hypothetical protein